MLSLEKPVEVDDPCDSADFVVRDARGDCVLTRSPFEETYPRYEFSELVRLGLALGNWIVRVRRLFAMSKPDVPPASPPGRIAAAD